MWKRMTMPKKVHHKLSEYITFELYKINSNVQNFIKLCLLLEIDEMLEDPEDEGLKSRYTYYFNFTNGNTAKGKFL